MIKIMEIVKKHHVQYFLLMVGLYFVKGILYFGVAKIPVEIHHFHMKIDDIIPFNKYFYVFYVSYYFLPIIFVWLLSFYNLDKVWHLIIGAFLANIIACILFVCYQVQMIRPEYYENLEMSFKDINNISDFFDFCIATQYNLDEGALNCFPSLHSVGGTLLVLIGWKTTKEEVELPKIMRVISLIFGYGIICSTVFVKQHYLIDAICGHILMMVTYYLGSIIYNYIKSKLNVKALIEEK